MKRKLALILLGFLSLGAFSDSQINATLFDYQSRYYNMASWRTMFNAGGDTVPSYASGYIDGYQAALNADYHALARDSGQGEKWIELPR